MARTSVKLLANDLVRPDPGGWRGGEPPPSQPFRGLLVRRPHGLRWPRHPGVGYLVPRDPHHIGRATALPPRQTGSRELQACWGEGCSRKVGQSLCIAGDLATSSRGWKRSFGGGTSSSNVWTRPQCFIGGSLKHRVVCDAQTQALPQPQNLNPLVNGTNRLGLAAELQMTEDVALMMLVTYTSFVLDPKAKLMLFPVLSGLQAGGALISIVYWGYTPYGDNRK